MCSSDLDHPEYSEVIDGNTPKFWEIVKDVPELYQRNVEEWENSVRRFKEKQNTQMVEWSSKHLEELRRGWTIECHFWNVTENRFGVDEEQIRADPSHWFLVNVDLHS